MAPVAVLAEKLFSVLAVMLFEVVHYQMIAQLQQAEFAWASAETALEFPKMPFQAE